ncbi:hypothetical protein CP03DC29_1507, partial [Chlamydia psittaci 03DC29]
LKPDYNGTRPAQTGFHLLKLDQTCSNRFKPDQIGSNRF